MAVTERTSRALSFSFLVSLVYLIPVVYAIGFNHELFTDFSVLAVLFVILHVGFYQLWYLHPKASLATSKVQLLFYMGIVFGIVMMIAYGTGFIHSSPAPVDEFFFSYVSLPVLYSGLAIANYILFVWALRIL